MAPRNITPTYTSSSCVAAPPIRTLRFLRVCLFRSETDTEVIAHLVGLELDSDPSMHLKVALAKTVAKLDGTWGLAVIAHEKYVKPRFAWLLPVWSLSCTAVRYLHRSRTMRVILHYILDV